MIEGLPGRLRSHNVSVTTRARSQRFNPALVDLAMAGGAPVPIPVSDPEDAILCIPDLQKAASKKLGKTAGGMIFIIQ